MLVSWRVILVGGLHVNLVGTIEIYLFLLHDPFQLR